VAAARRNPDQFCIGSLPRTRSFSALSMDLLRNHTVVEFRDVQLSARRYACRRILDGKKQMAEALVHLGTTPARQPSPRD